MKADLGSLDVGEVGLEVQQQDQAGSLEQVRRCRAALRQQPNLDDELGWEARLVQRRGAGQGVFPWMAGREVAMDHVLTIETTSTRTTLQLFVPRTT